VNVWNKPRTYVVLGVAALGLLLLHQFWVWEVERVEVEPGKFLVVTHLWGKDLPDGEIVAPDPSYKGIQRDVLPEGRHFLNPLFYSYERHDILEIPPGYCAVVTHKAGAEIAPERRARGEFLVEKDKQGRLSERGILREVLLPGRHRLNPYVFSVEVDEKTRKPKLVPMTRVQRNQVGVRTLRYGKDPSALKGRKSRYVVPEGYRGVQEKLVPSGDYYLNPYVEEVLPIDVDLRQVEFSDIYFPSRDGFVIQPHVRVSYKVIPEKAPELFVMLSNRGQLPQGDKTPEEQKHNPILQKFVLPLIRGWVRIEGSKYDARDYVSQQKEPAAAQVAGNPARWAWPLHAAADLGLAGLAEKAAVNPREELRKVLEEKVKPQCRELGVMIESITVAEIEKNADLTRLADLIVERETTQAARAKNAKLVDQYRREAKEKSNEALRERQTKLVAADRDLKVAQTQAEQQLEVEEEKLKAEKKAAQTRARAAQEQAKATTTRARAEAAVITAQNEAEVAGLKTAVAGFPTPDHFAQYHVLLKMAPALSEIFASDEGDFAKFFSGYVNQAPKKDGKRAVVDKK
jgi:hypothetical protein